ncbi:MAG: DedA family protein [Deltaproteobacteria bacterium]|nr:MAG: DedA family protein [Deltaproteobacteria bacterium]
MTTVRRLRRRLPLYWERFCWALLGLAAGGALLLWLAPDFAGTFLFTLYSMPANSLLPVPHEPGLLFAAKYYHPAWIALAGCVGTAVAAAIDYPVVRRAFEHPNIRRARNTRIYRLSVRWLMKFPFFTIFVFALTPLPIYVVRVLAPASGYPLWRYIFATVLGRFPRYYAIAWIGHLVQIPAWILVALFAAMVALLIAGSRVTDEIGIDGLEVLDASDSALPAVSDELAALADAGAPAGVDRAVATVRADERRSS